jgi:CspA family cold shock protein
MSTTQETSDRLTGMVKWFNNKAGFGFITVCGDGEYSNKDIFVHYSSIRVNNSQYKYLVQGEYVDFTLVKSDNEKHEYHATDVSGVLGGSIMCETRRMALSAQPQSQVPADRPRPYRTRPSESADGDFKRVESKRKSSAKKTGASKVVSEEA